MTDQPRQTSRSRYPGPLHNGAEAGPGWRLTRAPRAPTPSTIAVTKCKDLIRVVDTTLAAHALLLAVIA
ncbi:MULTISPECIES: hypothetical protein [unclassified Streptomyces]|uniref:hypothetical protein n=1 Tax=unclassified Streptomyces TaxID=2593676 RepID=UPI003450DC89